MSVRVRMSESLLLLLALVCLTLESCLAQSYTGVQASNTVASSLGSMVWNVNQVASFAVGDVVMVAWVDNTSDNMVGSITAVDPVALTITVDATKVNGPTGIQWSPWQFSIVTVHSGGSPSSSSSASSPVPSSTASSASSPTSAPQPAVPSSTASLSSAAVAASSSAGAAPSYTGVQASNTVASSLGSMVWNVNQVASFAVGDVVMVAWVDNTSDNMVGSITAVDPVALTITVDATKVNGPTGIQWSPWQFSIVTVHSGGSPSSSSSASSPVPSSTASSASSPTSAPQPAVPSSTASLSSAAVAASSSAGAAPSYTGVQASNTVASSLGSMVWNVNQVASFAVGDVVMVAWVDNTSDNMVGSITAVDPVALTITVDATKVNGPTGIQWSPWQFSLVQAVGAGSSGGAGGGGGGGNTHANGAAFASSQIWMGAMIVLAGSFAMVTLA